MLNSVIHLIKRRNTKYRFDEVRLPEELQSWRNLPDTEIIDDVSYPLSSGLKRLKMETMARLRWQIVRLIFKKRRCCRKLSEYYHRHDIIPLPLQLTELIVGKLDMSEIEEQLYFISH